MHGLLSVLPPVWVGAVEENVTLLGEPDRAEDEARATVQLSVSLRFFDLVGLLAFQPGMMLTEDELTAGVELPEALRFALVNSTPLQIEEYADLARAALSGPGRPFHRYTRMVAEAVTREFGIAAPKA
ncbi:hypothetical protein ACWEQL_16810 [Kitasatospora sp. NPDC004240]